MPRHSVAAAPGVIGMPGPTGVGSRFPPVCVGREHRMAVRGAARDVLERPYVMGLVFGWQGARWHGSQSNAGGL